MNRSPAKGGLKSWNLIVAWMRADKTVMKLFVRASQKGPAHVSPSTSAGHKALFSGFRCPD